MDQAVKKMMRYITEMELNSPSQMPNYCDLLYTIRTNQIELAIQAQIQELIYWLTKTSIEIQRTHQLQQQLKELLNSTHTAADCAASAHT